MKRIQLRTVLFFIALAPIASGQEKALRTPVQVALPLIERIERETSFELKSVTRRTVLDVQVVEFDRAFGSSPGAVGFALSAISLDGDTTLDFGVSAGIPVTIRVNDTIAYSSRKRSALIFREVGYGVFRFNDTVRLTLKKGPNRILIKGKLSGDHDVIYLRELFPVDAKPLARFDLGSVDTALRGRGWIYSGVYGGRGTDLFDVPLPPESGYSGTYTCDGRQFGWLSLPALTLQELIIPRQAVFKKESYAEWEYPNGGLMLSLLDYAGATNDTSAVGFVKRFCDFTIDHQELFAIQYERDHALRGTNHRLSRMSMLDDAGAAGLPFAELLVTTRDPRLEPIAMKVLRFIMGEQLRLADGTFCRDEPLPGTVWADDLFMSVPFLVRWGSYSGETKYYDEAARQALNFNDYLRDRQTGLFRHGWYGSGSRQAPVAWGRANGWVVWAVSELLSRLPADHPMREKIVIFHRDHLKAIVGFQSSSGLWHQVLDRPESFEETSCTAMFIVGMARGIRLGYLDESFVRPLERAWSGLQTRITDDGIVNDICRGTGMSDQLDFYLGRERFANDPRGLGAVISACAEMVRRVH